MPIDDTANRTMRSLEWERLCSYLAAEAHCSTGKQKCLNLTPEASFEPSLTKLEQTNEALSLLQARTAPSLQGLPEMTDVLRRLKTGSSLLGDELAALKITLTITRQIKSSLNLLERDSFPRLTAFIPRLHVLDKLHKAIDECIDDRGEVKDDASPALRSLRADIKRLDGVIKEELAKIINSSTLSKSLQEPLYTQRGGRYVVPVHSHMRSTIRGIVHDTSASGLTVYVEPMSVVELSNRIRLKEGEIETEIARILQELSKLCRENHDQIVSSFETAAEIDVVMARARLALRYDGHMPEFRPDSFFDYRSARHPLLVLQSHLSNVVANDISLGDEQHGRTLVITGPNTGGKTVLLKTVGMFALMLRAGLLPSAKQGSRAAFFPKVFADIGDEQSLEQSLSTFSSHMTNIVAIVDGAGPSTLILLDEVGAGTDPREGAALARAILEELNDSGAVTVSTTHYGELKVLAYTQAGFINGSLEFDPVNLSPSYRLRLGVPGSSQALSIARRLGLKESLIDQSNEYLNSGDRDLQKVIEELERKLAEIEEREADLQEQLASAKELQESAEQRFLELEAQNEKQRAALSREIDDELDLSRQYIKHVIAELQKQPSIARAQKAQTDLENLRKELGWNAPKPKGKGNEDKPAWQIGQSVKVRSLKQVGVIQSINGEVGAANFSVTVKAGPMKIKVPATDLELLPQGQQAPKSKTDQRSSKYSVDRGSPRQEINTFVRTGANTLDLRGQRVDEALPALERFLDESAMHGVPIAMIIHGHGTGAIKSAVRQYLSQSQYDVDFRTGESHEGGDGVTMVQFH